MLPYLSYIEEHATKFGNDKYEGYAKDLMDSIGKIAGFEYTFDLVEDNQAGTYDNNLGRWNGLIGEITEHVIIIFSYFVLFSYIKHCLHDF